MITLGVGCWKVGVGVCSGGMERGWGGKMRGWVSWQGVGGKGEGIEFESFAAGEKLIQEVIVII